MSPIIPPATESIYDGVVVPMPTFPFARIFIISEVVPTENRLAVPVAVDEDTDNSDVGVLVPIPTFPDV